MKKNCVRLDKLLMDRALFPSQERAQAMILAGRVLVNEQKVTKAGAPVDVESAIRILGEDLRYVSRGGLKLEKALEHWRIDLTGRTCLDVGASTGGFTDCMLQHGAAQLVAVDTGRGQIDAKLRNEPKLRLVENYNARHMQAADIPELVSFFAMDVSFISATNVLPAVIQSLWQGRECAQKEFVILVKPQFEVSRERIGKGGIVREEQAQLDAVEKVRACLVELGAIDMEVIDSPIKGMEGNREFLLHARLA